jgi:hypothetical protein
MNTLTPDEKIKRMMAGLQNAQVVERMRGEELARLRPTREAEEQASLDDYGVPIKDLLAWAQAEEAAANAEIAAVFDDFSKADSGEEDF